MDNIPVGTTSLRAQRSWQALVEVARPDRGSDPATAKEIAAAIEANTGREEYERKVTRHLLATARDLSADCVTHGLPDVLTSSLSDLVDALDQSALERLLLFAGGPGERLEAVTDLSSVVDPTAQLRVVLAAAEVLNEEVSSWQVRLLDKMAVLTGEAGSTKAATADRALRLVIRDILRQWVLESPHIDVYEQVLRRLAVPAPGDESEGGAIASIDAERILQMCMEIGDGGQAALRSLQALQQRGELAKAIDILDKSPIEGKALARLWGQIASTETVEHLLAQDPPDFDRLDILLPRVKADAVAPMLLVLADCESRPDRKRLMDRLAAFGGTLLPLVIEWLADERWFVKRNMLVLLQEMAVWPEGILETDPFLTHPKAAVRREAVKLFLQFPSERDAALRVALGDADASILTLGLAAAEEECPNWAVPRLAELLGRSDFTNELRSAVIRALGISQGDEALGTLLDSVLAWKIWPVRKRLTDTSPALLLALELIAGRWGTDPRSRKALALAEASTDPAVREAARVEGGVE